MPFFTADPDPVTLEIIEQVCADVASPLKVIGQDQVDEMNRRLGDREIGVGDESLLHADYQRWNAAVARRPCVIFFLNWMTRNF